MLKTARQKKFKFVVNAFFYPNISVNNEKYDLNALLIFATYHEELLELCFYGTRPLQI